MDNRVYLTYRERERLPLEANACQGVSDEALRALASRGGLAALLEAVQQAWEAWAEGAEYLDKEMHALRALLPQTGEGEGTDHANVEPVSAEEAERQAQRISFAFGNVALSNPNVTRETVEEAARKNRATTPAPMSEGERDSRIDVFLSDVRAEFHRGREKFPGNELKTVALSEEFGELVKAVLDEAAADVRKEAVQVAAMCLRLVIDGDSSVDGWRERNGLDALSKREDGA